MGARTQPKESLDTFGVPVSFTFGGLIVFQFRSCWFVFLQANGPAVSVGFNVVFGFHSFERFFAGI